MLSRPIGRGRHTPLAPRHQIARDLHDVAYDRAARWPDTRPTADKRIGPYHIPDDGDRIVHAIHAVEQIALWNQRGVHAHLDLTLLLFGDGQRLHLVAQ